MILQIVGRFDIGVLLAGKVESRLGSLRSGVIRACCENVLLGRIGLLD